MATKHTSGDAAPLFSPTSSPPPERPLGAGQAWQLMLGAAGVQVLFYAYCALAILLTVVLRVERWFLIFVTVRAGGDIEPLNEIERRLRQTASVIVQGMRLRRPTEHRLLLTEEDAPRLHRTAADIARKAQVAPPDEIVLDAGITAGVLLKGYGQGSGRTRLSVGLDLLVILPVPEFEAVLAHDMAHARLVQRGFRGSLAKGAARMSRVALGLSDIGPPPPSKSALIFDLERQRFFLTHYLAAAAIWLSKTGTRLVAASVRQDEFAADRLAAQICGTGPCRAALIRTHQLALLEESISWRDRRLRIETGEGLLPWLRARLTPRDEQHARTLRDRVLADTNRDERDTHPSLAERLAALPAGTGENSDDLATPAGATAAEAMLSAPEALAKRLTLELERAAAERERRHSTALHQRLRRDKRGRPYPFWKRICRGLFYTYCFISFLGWLDLAINPGRFNQGDRRGVFTNFLFILAVIAITIRQRRATDLERLDTLPIPSLAHWDAALKTRAEKFSEDHKDLVRELRAQIPEGSQKVQLNFLLTTGREALAVCDYGRAQTAARLALEHERYNMEALMTFSVGAAYYGQSGAVEQAVGAPIKAFGISPGSTWTMAWAYCLLGRWPAAEPYLLDAVAHRPWEPTLLYLLALCQSRIGKVREALSNVDKAIEREPEAAPAHLLAMQMLLATGQIHRALNHQTLLERLTPGDFEVMLGGLQAHVLGGNFEEASQRAASLEKTHPGRANYCRLGWELLDSDHEEMKEQSRRYFGMALQRGFYPEAMLGLGRLEQRAHRPEQARRLLLTAVDLTRERPDDAGHPMAILDTACEGLIELEEPVPDCRIWTATLSLEGIEDAPDTLRLLVCHQTLEAAKEQVRDLYAALNPGRAWSHAYATWDFAPAELQPTGPVSPGVRAYTPEYD